MVSLHTTGVDMFYGALAVLVGAVCMHGLVDSVLLPALQTPAIHTWLVTLAI